MRYPVKLNLELRRNPYKGKYIALEGIDGSGKSTQVKLLADYYKKLGKKVIVTREPRKEGIIGDLIREVLLGEKRLPAVSLQYLFSADRAAHHAELIEPSLKKGAVVISDRCFFSAIVYGILDKTGGKYDKNVADLLLISQSILSMYHQFIVPDYTFLLEIPLKESMQRLSNKEAKKEIYEDKGKIAKVLSGYKYLADRFSKEITVIDGTGSVGDVTKRILENLKF